MAFDEIDEVGRRESGERGFAEMRAAAGDVIGRRDAQVREIAPASTGDENFLPETLGVFEHDDFAAPPAGFDGAHQPRRTAADDHDVAFHARS